MTRLDRVRFLKGPLAGRAGRIVSQPGRILDVQITSTMPAGDMYQQGDVVNVLTQDVEKLHGGKPCSSYLDARANQ